MVEEYLISAAAALLTAAVMAAVSLGELKREGISGEKKNRRLWAIGAVLYIGAAFLFAYYGYSFWKRERYYILLCTLPVLALTDRMERRIPIGSCLYWEYCESLSWQGKLRHIRCCGQILQHMPVQVRRAVSF